MFYIDIIADGERVSGPETSEDENVAWDLFCDLEREAIDLSIEYPAEFSVRMITSTVFADGQRIA